MRCRQIRRLLVMEDVAQYGEGGEPRIARHLARCSVCREAADRFSGDVRLLRAAFLSLPLRPDFKSEVLRRIREG